MQRFKEQSQKTSLPGNRAKVDSVRGAPGQTACQAGLHLSCMACLTGLLYFVLIDEDFADTTVPGQVLSLLL